jgi:DNA helicase-2/ATP-dependent DNA helicase PcrA
MGISQYQALSRIGEAEDGEIPITLHIGRKLADFRSLMEELIAASRERSLLELFDLVTTHTGYREYLLAQPDGEERWENILELRTVAQQYRNLPPAESLTAFLEGVALVSDVDGLDETVDAVTLITLHQAKGLEFPVVFIVGMEEGVLPHFRSFDDPAQMEEERRLCYVGVTRAGRLVYLVRAGYLKVRRRIMG